MKKLIESKNEMEQAVAQIANLIFGPFPTVFRLSYSLFWSVFGPAAQFDFGNPKYAYASQ